MPSTSSEESVQLLAAQPAELSDVYDAATGRYRRFTIPPLSENLQGEGQVVGVMDSGLLSDHPDLRERVIAQHDFTGTSPVDESGHGTRVALVLAAYVPGARLVNLKVLSRQAPGPAGLLAGLNWLATEENPCRIVNLSAGVYRLDCDGHCDICEAARRAEQAGVMIVAAAGNWAGVTACPAKASDAVVAVAEIDADTGRLTATSSPAGPGGVAAPSPGLVPAEWIDPDPDPDPAADARRADKS